MATIFCYVGVFQIWYKGQHFELSPVQGIARQQWQQPTKGCNPSHIDCKSNWNKLTELPYCAQYTGNHSAQIVEDCEYFDGIELPITLPGGVLLPTYVATFRQGLRCPSGSTVCDRKFGYLDAGGEPQGGTGYAMPTSAAFVADVERFTVLVDHSFRTMNGKVAHDDLSMQGYFQTCRRESSSCEKKPIRCMHSACREMGMYTGGARDSLLSSSMRVASRWRTGGRRASQLAEGSALRTDAAGLSLNEALAETAASVEESVIAIEDGDVLSLRTLLSMAGLSLDEPVLKESDRNDTRTIRLRGAALVLHIHYDNTKPWTLFRPQDPPEYTLSVTSRPVHKFKHRYVASEGPTGRELRSAYGVYIVVEQSGEIASFNMVHSLVILTTALGLLMAANTFTDLLALYVLPRKEMYKDLKFQVSDDFNPMSQTGRAVEIAHGVRETGGD
eukprot:CAMPEP_0179016556 /NCGR_PEP_ID=MMETSP0796-20121207/3381_1 /TAXON_ID=73915 /ORGANISM="Pyrodinium bahamense, Strain pbaha01" /LENGTH=444 /DNA_ID=CAMNT_0020712251 /DNA_START=153 /DNA_END=1488 /DNA_ORIENTATION=+